MTVSLKDLEQIAGLAYLNLDAEQPEQLSREISSIMDFVEQLRSVNTQHMEPLFHPLELHQRLRMDVITEEECIAELQNLAPLFEENLYLVPKVLESGN